jgi:hypothetical protein
MKTEHPTLVDILSVLEGRAMSTETSRHIAQGCTSCGDALARYRPLLRSLAADHLTAAPRDLKRKALLALAAERRRRAGRAVAEKVSDVIGRIAALILDSGTAPAMAGVRGAAVTGSVAPVRHLIFESDNDRFTVRVQRSADCAAFDLMGQVLLTTGAPASVPITLRPEKGRARTAESESTGEFAFANVRPGRYALIVETMDGPVTLPGIDLS